MFTPSRSNAWLSAIVLTVLVLTLLLNVPRGGSTIAQQNSAEDMEQATKARYLPMSELDRLIAAKADEFKKCRSARDRLLVCISAIDEGLVDVDAPIADVKRIFGDAFDESAFHQRSLKAGPDIQRGHEAVGVTSGAEDGPQQSRFTWEQNRCGWRLCCGPTN